MKKKLAKIREMFIGPTGKQGIIRNKSVYRQLGYVSGSLSSSWDKPTQSQLTYFRQAESKMKEAMKAYHDLFEKEVVEYQQKVEKSKFTLFPEFDGNQSKE